MSLIYLIRHGETEWNLEKVFRGRKDIPLSEKGKKEALALAKVLSEKSIKFIYSSPLTRALETAKPISEKTGIPVKTIDGFIDLDFGQWEGKSVKEVEESDPGLFRLWATEPEKVVFPGGESLKSAKERAMDALLKVVKDNPGKDGVVVSHRVICKLLVLSAIGAGEAQFWRVQQDLACYNIIEWNQSGFSVRLVNETCHLKAIEGHLNMDF